MTSALCDFRDYVKQGNTASAWLSFHWDRNSGSPDSTGEASESTLKDDIEKNAQGTQHQPPIVESLQHQPEDM